MDYVRLNADELVQILDHIIKTNSVLQEQGKFPLSVEINAISGLGKTSLVRQVAKNNNLAFVKVNLAQIEELGDLVGYPIDEFEMCKPTTSSGALQAKIIDGKKVMVPVETSPKECVWANKVSFSQYVAKGYEFTGQTRMSYAVPSWVPRDEENLAGGILLLDDWNRASVRFMQAAMELVNEQVYYSWKLPPKWTIILTANPENSEYTVTPIDKAQRTRLNTFGMKWDETCWARWAEKAGIDGRCINFVLMHPELIQDDDKSGINPRSLTKFFDSISTIPDFNTPEALNLIQILGESSVGEAVSTIFAAFIHNNLDKLITPKEMLLGKDEEAVVKEILQLVAPSGPNSYRADIAGTLAMRFTNYTTNLVSKGHGIDKQVLDRTLCLLKHPDLFTNDLRYTMTRNLLAGHSGFAKLVNDPVVHSYLMS